MSRRWNNGDMELDPARMRRVRVSHREPVAAAAGRVFSLLGPWEQARWFEGWDSSVVHSESGRNEEDAVWWERTTGPALFGIEDLSTVGYVSLWDPSDRKYHVVLGNPGLAYGKLEIELRGAARGVIVDLELTYTALSESGNELFGGELAKKMQDLLERYGGMLRAFAERTPEEEGGDDGPTAGSGEGFTGRRTGTAVEATLEGDPDACFALACPVAELDWIDDWKFQMVYSDSGVSEEHCIFTEATTGLGVLRAPGAMTSWYTTHRDEGDRRASAVLLTEDFAIAWFEFAVDDLGDGRSRIRLSTHTTGLTERGNRIIAEPGFDAARDGMLRFLVASAKTYLEEGEMRRLSTTAKLKMLISLVWTTIRRYLRPR